TIEGRMERGLSRQPHLVKINSPDSPAYGVRSSLIEQFLVPIRKLDGFVTIDNLADAQGQPVQAARRACRLFK
ncbi:hypothetical protein ACWGTI_30705, partial [Mesorhizobium sp. ArgA1]